jgi:N-acetyl-alpha-D-glucosaminyl L-malate synthase BshA
VHVIPNFVDGDVFSPTLRSRERRLELAPEGEAIVGHLSNFRPVKRVLDVVRAFSSLQKRLPARLVMVGAGVDLEPARNLAAELGIHERVQFLGALDRVAEVLAQLDLFLLPSEYESFGLAALEAMACGVPVISTRTGGVAEVVEHGVSGLLCAVGDTECMAAEAFRILSDRAGREAMGRAARARALSAFPRDRVVERYAALYREVLGRSA